jgi:hypothetical protein
MQRSLLFGLLVLLILLPPAFFGVMLVGEIDWTSKFAAESATTTGEVIDFVVYEDSEGDEVSAAVVRFTTPDGQTATVEDSTRHAALLRARRPGLGALPHTNPSDAIISEGSNLWRATIVSAVLFGVFLLLSPLLIHEAYKRLQRARYHRPRVRSKFP